MFYSVFDSLLNYVNHICDVASVEYDMLYRKKMKNVISFNAKRTITLLDKFKPNQNLILLS